MVRLAWQTEDGTVAVAKRHQVAFADLEGCLHLQLDIEITSKYDAVGACFTMPTNCLTQGQVLKTGILFLHEAKANAWNSKLAANLAVSLASVGYMVVRSKCTGRRQLREIAAEKAMATCAASPYGSAIQQWIVIGFGSGGQIAARLSASTRQVVRGLGLVSFPLQSAAVSLNSMTGLKAIQIRNKAEECLLRFSGPLLLVHSELDVAAPLDKMADLVKEMSTQDARMLLVEGCDKHLRPPHSNRTHPSTIDEVTNTVLEFVSALDRGSLSLCTTPRATQVLAEIQLSAAQRPVKRKAAKLTDGQGADSEPDHIQPSEQDEDTQDEEDQPGYGRQPLGCK